jgi:hypothetical protein
MPRKSFPAFLRKHEQSLRSSSRGALDPGSYEGVSRKGGKMLTHSGARYAESPRQLIDAGARFVPQHLQREGLALPGILPELSCQDSRNKTCRAKGGGLAKH